MPFGLKNIEETYQLGMNYIFHDYICDFVEVYIDDIVIKSSSFKTHLVHLRKIFKRMHRCQLKLNPLKYAFAVSARVFLGFLVHKKGIEFDQNKDDAIINSQPPSNKEELQQFLGKVNFLIRLRFSPRC